MTQVINLEEKFSKFSSHWHPHIVAEANGQHVRLAKLKGEFVWHSHAEEEELFIVVKGILKVRFRGHDEIVHPGELLVIPRGVEHMPVAEEEVHLINITKAEASHTGNTETDIQVSITDMPII